MTPPSSRSCGRRGCRRGDRGRRTRDGMVRRSLQPREERRVAGAGRRALAGPRVWSLCPSPLTDPSWASWASRARTPTPGSFRVSKSPGVWPSIHGEGDTRRKRLAPSCATASSGSASTSSSRARRRATPGHGVSWSDSGWCTRRRRLSSTRSFRRGILCAFTSSIDSRGLDSPACASWRRYPARARSRGVRMRAMRDPDEDAARSAELRDE